MTPSIFDPKDKTWTTVICVRQKKALPSSSSNTTVIPDQPSTYPHWQTALQQVKVQYLKRQYKQCASRCTQLLTAHAGEILPIHKTFLHFYAALSYEALARSTHNLSAAKLSTLHLARESYEAAAASLPRSANLPFTDDDEGEGNSSASFSDTASSTSLYSDTTSNTPNDGENPTSPQTTSPTPSRSPSSSSSFRTDNLKPSPLRIRKKAVHFTPTPSPPRPQLTLFSPLRAPSTYQYHYNTHLISFATMLQTHILTVDALLHNTSAAQTHGRRSGAYSASEEGNGYGEDEERKSRIERLKITGWRRERFVPERYEELCARALAEL